MVVIADHLCTVGLERWIPVSRISSGQCKRPMESPTHRAKLREVFLEGLAQHLLLVAGPKEVCTQERTIVK